MIFKDLTRPELIEESLRRGETKLSSDGAIVCYTGKFTGRAAKDKYIVKDASTENLIDWGKVNQPISAEHFKNLKNRVLAVLDRGDSFVQRLSVGADQHYTMPIVVRTEYAYQALFAQTMFRGPAEGKAAIPEFTVYSAPSALADPKTDGTRSETFIAVDFQNREIVIGGTKYSGEIKKSIFTVMNWVLPQMGIMTMHSGANLGDNGKSAVFFGLSGTGKTTLSADSSRKLIGDDEHGWSKNGVFNFEGGCYAKAIRLSPKAEPEIWAACHTFGTILENVVMDPRTRKIDFDSAEITENTRAAYPISMIPNFEPTGMGGHPSAIVMLACDAYGILPPVARLTADQAMYYFLSGYTAKVAGTEAGVTEPEATFSTCFGAPFMPLKPTVYAKLLGEHLRDQKTPCYLINTGWWKGPYGVGERMPISMSRRLVNAAISGELQSVACETDEFFGFEVPIQVKGIDSQHLNNRNTWSDKNAYRERAKKLAAMFIENFKKYEDHIGPEVRQAGPRL